MTNDLLSRIQRARSDYDRALVSPMARIDRLGIQAQAELLRSIPHLVGAAGFETGARPPAAPGGDFVLRIFRDFGDAIEFRLEVRHPGIVGLFKKAAKDGRKQFDELERFAMLEDE